ncbi:MAG: pantetheine-phosphate adenylyltransferase [Gammaproteobacteria bacterium RIFCSPHIGHO2_12_FULL_38_14]|nr:MAG: pantetheine-phosphate adenylyltransferase [Gammaproteobacteria bacterium RIFCSPHIGHO2_12_FULL_38_14]
MSSLKRIAVYAGTFDPITNGHCDIISRAAKLFDEVIIGVAASEHKKPYFSAEKRLCWCQESTCTFSNVHAELFANLTVEFAHACHAQYLVRGIRTVDDMDYELSIASMNAALSKDSLETVFLSSSAAYRFISSTMIREIMALKGDVSAFVPACVQVG